VGEDDSLKEQFESESAPFFLVLVREVVQLLLDQEVVAS